MKVVHVTSNDHERSFHGIFSTMELARAYATELGKTIQQSLYMQYVEVDEKCKQKAMEAWICFIDIKSKKVKREDSVMQLVYAYEIKDSVQTYDVCENPFITSCSFESKNKARKLAFEALEQYLSTKGVKYQTSGSGPNPQNIEKS